MLILCLYNSRTAPKCGGSTEGCPHASRYVWLSVIVATSRFTESTELCADSIESHPSIPLIFAESTYQVDQDQKDALVSSSPAYTRRGRCNLKKASIDIEGKVTWYVCYRH